MFKLAIVLCLISSILAAQKSYDGYKVVQVKPATLEQSYHVRGLEDEEGIDFWDPIHYVVDYPTRVMVSQEKLKFVENYLTFANVPYNVIIENVEE